MALGVSPERSAKRPVVGCDDAREDNTPTAELPADTILDDLLQGCARRPSVETFPCRVRVA